MLLNKVLLLRLDYTRYLPGVVGFVLIGQAGLQYSIDSISDNPLRRRFPHLIVSPKSIGPSMISPRLPMSSHFCRAREDEHPSSLSDWIPTCLGMIG